MTPLTDFATVENARAYELTTYRKIGGNEARQIFAERGGKKSLVQALNNETPVELVPGEPTTIGELVEAVLDTVETNGQFATDPNTSDGLKNRGMSQILIDAGVLTQGLNDAFYEKAVVRTFPYENVTLCAFLISKGDTSIKKEVSPSTKEPGHLQIKLNEDAPEQHNPQVYIKVGNDYVRKAGFRDVQKAGTYTIEVPREYSTFYVDNAYGVIA